MSTVDYVALAFLIAAAPVARRHRGYATILACVGLALPLASFAEAMMSTVFMLYDDEGYVLHTLKSFVDGGALYDRVYTQYGPLPYVLWKLLSLLGIGPTHDNGRLLTLLLWLAAGGLCAGLAWRLSRNGVAALAALTGSVLLLWMCANEPSHPGALVCLLACAAGFIVSARRPLTTMESFALGLLTAGLLLTKINTGIFMIAALGTWWSVGAFRGKWRSLAWLVVGIAVALPWLLMRPSLAEPAMRQFALISSLSLLAALLVMMQHAPRAPRGLRPVAALAGLVGGTFAVLLFMLAMGSSLGGLLDGIVLRPLAHPVSYNEAVYWRPGALILALLAPVLVFPLLVLKPKGCIAQPSGLDRPWSNPVMGFAVVIFVMFNLSVAEMLGVSMQGVLMSYGMSCSWLLAWPKDENDHGGDARRAVVLVMLFQTLHAYPVAVTQIGWGMVLWVPLACAVAVPWLWSLVKWACSSFGTGWPRAVALAVAVALFFGIAVRHEHLARERKLFTLPLGLPGAHSLQLPVHTVASLRVIVANSGGAGDVLFSMTGMYSFNLWTGARTPTSRNITQWHRLLTQKEQADILEVLRATPSARIIRNVPLCDYLGQHGFPLRGLLADEINSEYRSCLRVNGLELLQRRSVPEVQRKPLGILTREGAILHAYLPRSWIPSKASLSLYYEEAGVVTWTMLPREHVSESEADGSVLVRFEAKGRPVLIVRDEAGEVCGVALCEDEN